MGEAALNTVGCPACRRRFVWKPDLAGRAVKCTCGKAFVIAAAPENLALDEPAAAQRRNDQISAGDFEVQEQRESVRSKCPSCNLPMKAGAWVCLNCGYDLRKRKRMTTQVADMDEVAAAPLPAAAALPAAPSPPLPPSPDFVAPVDHTPAPSRAPAGRRSRVTEALVAREDDQAQSKFLDLYLPIIFLVAGCGLTVLNSLQKDGTVVTGLMSAGFHLLVKVPLMLVAVMLTARLMGISYGPLSIGLLKLAGIAMGPMALADVLLAFIMGQTLGMGFLLGIFFYIIIAGTPISFMFDLDLNETAITLTIMIVLEILFSVFIWAILMGMFV